MNKIELAIGAAMTTIGAGTATVGTVMHRNGRKTVKDLKALHTVDPQGADSEMEALLEEAATKKKKMGLGLIIGGSVLTAGGAGVIAHSVMGGASAPVLVPVTEVVGHAAEMASDAIEL